MGAAKKKLHVCRRCGNEKTRKEANGRCTYYCNCLEWSESQTVLEWARKKGS